MEKATGVLEAIEALERDRDKVLRALLGDDLGASGLVHDCKLVRETLEGLSRWVIVLTGVSVTATLIALLALVTLWLQK